MRAPDEESDSAASASKFGRYDILELLATGGMARIYKASTAAQRIFTIKKILKEYSRNDEFIQMFLEEAKISLQLKHPNIVRVLDFGQIDGSHYLAMEYVFGRDTGSLLKRTLEKKVHVPIDVACQIIIQACRGMQYAHTLTDQFGGPLGIVHRDISPPNILISYNGEAKILDFGIAKAVRAASHQNTRSGVLKGKFSYMSPEQAHGQPLNHQSDLFSLGIVLHELLTSRSLFYSRDELETLERVRKAEIKPPSTIRKNLPEALDRIVMKALQLKLKKRYADCGEFADELEGFLKQEYPRSDLRNVAKFSRLIFEDDFQARVSQAQKEGWKDVLVSGGEDSDLLLDRSREGYSSHLPSRHTTVNLQLRWWDRLLYDPKTSARFFRAAGTLGGLAFVLIVGLWYQSDIRAWLEPAPVERTSAESHPSPVAQVASKEDLPKIERGSLQFWIEEASKAEQMEQPQKALESLERALAINSFDASLQIRKYFLILRLGDGTQACSWFQSQRDIPPPDRMIAESACAEFNGETQKAMVGYSDFLKRFPNEGRASYVRDALDSLRRKHP